jgi:hypothetical protein
MSEEFDLNSDFSVEGIVPKPRKQGRSAKAAKVVAPEIHEAPEVDEEVSESVEAKPSEQMVNIMIDEVDGMPNYEVVGVNGYVYKIKRGEKVAVPISVVKILENAIATRTVQREDRVTGELLNEYRNYSAIPWRRV